MPDNILIYCLRGKGWYEPGKKRFEVGVNEFIIIPAIKSYLRYGADENDPWTIYWVHFSGRDMDTFNRSFGIGMFDGPQPPLKQGLSTSHFSSLFRKARHVAAGLFYSFEIAEGLPAIVPF